MIVMKKLRMIAAFLLSKHNNYIISKLYWQPLGDYPLC